MFVYLDNSATTKQYEAVTAEMLKYMKHDFGNPSSLHGLGIEAEKAVKAARVSAAAALGVLTEEVYFTSGGTESDNAAVYGALTARKRTGKKIITSAVEHPAMIEACRRAENEGFEVVYLDVDDRGIIDMAQLESEMDDEVVFVSVMHVNNETGTVQPIEMIGSLKDAFNKKRRRNKTGMILHTDAVQSFCKLRCVSGLKNAGVDMISVSSHKVHGPKGVGALYIRGSINVSPFIVGGGQEKNMRSGTENVPGIAGFGKAVDLCMKGTTDGDGAAVQGLDEVTGKMSKCRAFLLEGIRSEIKDVKVNSPENVKTEGATDTAGEVRCCPSILNISFLGTRGEVILHTLEERGIYVSTGSACSSNKKGRSHVLSAMGLSDKEIESAVRFSFSGDETVEQMEYVLSELKTAVERFRRLGLFR